MTELIPHFEPLEAHICGSALMGGGVPDLDPMAFHTMKWRALWEQILANGAERIDLTILSSFGGGKVTMEATTRCSPISGQAERAERLRHLHYRRQLQAWSAEVNEAARTDEGLDVTIAKQPMLEVGVDPSALIPETVEAFRTRPVDEADDWVVPGLMRRGWRCMVVAREGVGKMVLLRQIAVAAAQGIHPFTYRDIPPIRSIVLDFENPDDVIDEHLDLIARGVNRWTDGQAWVWHHREGLNLRERRWQVVLDRIFTVAHPDLVCLGPLYKAFRSKTSEQWEEVAVEVCNALDDLRTRHRFALIIEHHAAKGEKTARGSAVWLGWPEFGLFLDVADVANGKVQSVDVRRFREDRAAAEWPDRLSRGKEWPWEARWDHGLRTERRQEF